MRIRYLETTPETAESIKYMANTLLLTYISFWNGVGARLGEAFPNIRMEDLKLGVTSDDRISTWGSYVSNGAGGSCFGKDIQSLIYQINNTGRSTDLLQAVYNINEFQKIYLIDRAVHEAGFNFNQKSVALLGLAFKKRTNDMRDSAALKVVESLLVRGVKEIRAYDPLAMEDAQRDGSIRKPTISSNASATSIQRAKQSRAAMCFTFQRTGKSFVGCRAPLRKPSSRLIWSSTAGA